jgi:hypothetical protein
VLPAIVRLQKLCNHVALLEPTRNADPNSSKYKDVRAYEGFAFGLIGVSVLFILFAVC